MTGPDVSRLSAADVTATVRSFPRRYREAMSVEPGEDLEDLAHRAGPQGRSAADCLTDTVSTLAVLERGIQEVTRSEQPLLHPSVLDPTLREWAPPPAMAVSNLLEMLDDQAGDLANTVEKVATLDWERTGRIADGPAVSAIELGREAARVGADNLRQANEAMRSARGT